MSTPVRYNREDIKHMENFTRVSRGVEVMKDGTKLSVLEMVAMFRAMKNDEHPTRYKTLDWENLATHYMAATALVICSWSKDGTKIEECIPSEKRASVQELILVHNRLRPAPFE